MAKSTEVYRFAGMQGQSAKIALRNILAEAQNWRCCYCGRELDQMTATIEHVIKGKRYEWSPDAKYNLVVACAGCNRAASRFKDGYEYFTYRCRLNQLIMSANADGKTRLIIDEDGYRVAILVDRVGGNVTPFLNQLKIASIPASLVSAYG